MKTDKTSYNTILILAVIVNLIVMGYFLYQIVSYRTEVAMIEKNMFITPPDSSDSIDSGYFMTIDDVYIEDDGSVLNFKDTSGNLIVSLSKSEIHHISPVADASYSYCDGVRINKLESLGAEHPYHLVHGEGCVE